MSEIRQLTPAQLKPIYKQYMRKEFPIFELRPYRIMARLIYNNKYVAYGYFDNDNNIQAYACIYLQTDDRDISRSDYALLDYFAVVPDLQNQGVGSAFLRALADEVPVINGLFIECENPNSTKNKNERDKRERRIRFYEKNGCVSTSIKCKILHITFDLMLLRTGGNNSNTDTHALLKSAAMLYKNIYGKQLSKIIKIYSKNIYTEGK